MKSYLKLFVAVFFILAAIRVTKADLYSVSGKVRYSDNNEIVTSGSVKCYNSSTFQLEAVALIEPTGDYILPFVRGATPYDVIGFPNTEPEADFVPTFYPDQTNPQQATTVYVSGNMTGVDLYVQRVAGSGGSPFLTNVSGLILDKNNLPVKDAIVYVQRGNDNYGYGITDAKGQYKINNIPTGDFILVAHKLANQSESRPVTINENGLNVNFVMNKLNPGNAVTIPAKFSLTQNYPNPFNPSTTINYSIAENSLVSLKVYNSVGQLVSTLVEGTQEAGSYRMSFDASNLSSGVYYYRLDAGSFSDTKKMTLIK
ncbi:MAG TPA: T9SS type A sorting domain-containing protein [Ignavibacteria bacterium]|jgi:hypothetical protein